MSQEQANNRAQKMASMWNRPGVRIGIIVAVIALIGGVAAWIIIGDQTVYADKSVVTAPVIELSPHSSGVLEQLYAHEGDMVAQNAMIARVGDELIKTKTDGQVVFTLQTIGATVNPGTVVARIVRPEDLRVEAHVKENSGLQNVHVGQTATFTVDAFGSKQYTGIVDEVSNTSRSGDIVFSISDKREQQDFDVKIRFDVNTYPELKNGMSAKVWIQK